jgi:REP element-mobilizing transposase RayT
MSHTYCKNFVHCVFSTKERRPLIPAERQEQLWAYLFGIAKNETLNLIAAGGTTNHVHLLMALPPVVTLAQAIQTFKGNSSRWMGADFAWQQGYGGFSVSASQLATVKAYIKNQAEHHQKRSFEEEFIARLKSYGIEYDPQFVFG